MCAGHVCWWRVCSAGLVCAGCVCGAWLRCVAGWWAELGKAGWDVWGGIESGVDLWWVWGLDWWWELGCPWGGWGAEWGDVGPHHQGAQVS